MKTIQATEILVYCDSPYFFNYTIFELSGFGQLHQPIRASVTLLSCENVHLSCCDVMDVCVIRFNFIKIVIQWCQLCLSKLYYPKRTHGRNKYILERAVFVYCYCLSFSMQIHFKKVSFLIVYRVCGLYHRYFKFWTVLNQDTFCCRK